MCSVGDDALEEQASKFMQKTDANALNPACNKCGGPDTRVVLRKAHAYCKGCFLAGASHKFRALLGKHRLVSPGDKLLVCVNGDHASTALLHLLHKGVGAESSKRLRCRPTVICVHGEIADEDKTTLREIQGEAQSYGFPFHFISQPEYTRRGDGAAGALLSQHLDSFGLKSDAFEANVNETNQQSVQGVYRQRLLKDVARHLGCRCVFTTEISSDVATQLLTNLSLGRGSQIALDTGVCDTRDASIKIIRPLRLFDMKELVFYNHFNGLKPKVFDKPSNPATSVQNLMKTFVDGLQTDYPATITTIMRIGDKLISAKGAEGDVKTCDFCQAPVESAGSELTSKESTSFSRWISTGKPVEDFACESAPGYCYGCSKIMAFS